MSFVVPRRKPWAIFAETVSPKRRKPLKHGTFKGFLGKAGDSELSGVSRRPPASHSRILNTVSNRRASIYVGFSGLLRLVPHPSSRICLRRTAWRDRELSKARAQRRKPRRATGLMHEVNAAPALVCNQDGPDRLRTAPSGRPRAKPAMHRRCRAEACPHHHTHHPAASAASCRGQVEGPPRHPPEGRSRAVWSSVIYDQCGASGARQARRADSGWVTGVGGVGMWATPPGLSIMSMLTPLLSTSACRAVGRGSGGGDASGGPPGALAA